MRTALRALIATLLLAAITGIAYPLVMTGIGQVAFAHDANGSLVDVNGQPGAVMMDTTDRLVGVMELDIVDGEVQSVRTIVNPDKLQHLGPVSDILRRDSNRKS